MSNSAVAVATYNNSGLAPLKNSSALVANSNQRFKDFNSIILNQPSSYAGGPGISGRQMANRGPTVGYDIPARIRAVQGNGSLDTTNVSNDMIQRERFLTVNRSAFARLNYKDTEFVLNYLDYMPKFVTPAINSVAQELEYDLAQLALTNTYRCLGDGTTPLNSFQQIASYMATYKSFGSTGMNRIQCYLPGAVFPAIVKDGLGQFVLNRNEEIAEDWFVGSANGVDFYSTDRLPSCIVPSLTAGATLNLVSYTVSSDYESTTLVFNVTGPAGANAYQNISNFLQAGQIIKFGSNQSIGAPGALSYLGYSNYSPSAQPVTVNVTTNENTDNNSNISITVTPGLIYDTSSPQVNAYASLSKQLAAGMTATVVPSHVCGLMVDNNALLLATPKLSHLEPYPCSESIDPETGIALRTYYGSLFGTGSNSFITDIAWGVDLPPDYAARIAIPYSQVFNF